MRTNRYQSVMERKSGQMGVICVHTYIQLYMLKCQSNKPGQGAALSQILAVTILSPFLTLPSFPLLGGSLLEALEGLGSAAKWFYQILK